MVRIRRSSFGVRFLSSVLDLLDLRYPLDIEMKMSIRERERESGSLNTEFKRKDLRQMFLEFS